MTFDEPMALRRYADLTVAFAANVQPGQVVAISTDLGKEELARAVADSAYRRGACFVDVHYFDPYVRRARLQHALDETLGYVPPWYGERLLELARQRGSRIALTGPTGLDVLNGVDPRRAARDRLPWVKEIASVVDARTTNWTAVPAPTRGWAQMVHPDLPPREAWTQLCAQLERACRLDEPDPVAAWRERAGTLKRAATRMTARNFTALRFRGDGTDITIGLLPSSRWLTAVLDTVDGVEHLANLPSEEIFTAPDPTRADGVVRATKPLVIGGSIVRGLEVEFREGRAVRIDATANAEVLRGWIERDDGASRLGEVALVDGDGRVGALDTIFFDTLLDENAASHLALGQAFTTAAGDGDRPQLNSSGIHVDFMIGGPGVEVTGMTGDGAEVLVLQDGRWQL